MSFVLSGLGRGTIHRALFPVQTVVNTRHISMAEPANKEASSSRQSTINPEEVDKFRRMAHDWWDPAGPAKGLLSMNRLRVPFITDGLKNGKKCLILSKSRNLQF